MPGETVIQRANTFTNYAGRFLYVEAHNKGVIQTGTGNGTGRTLALSFAGADGVFGTATNMGVFRDTDPNPDVYMYHRQLIRLTGDAASIPADQMTVRVAAVATGGTTTSTDTFKVTEWTGKSCRRTSPTTSRASSTATRTRPRTGRTWTRWPPSTRTW